MTLEHISVAARWMAYLRAAETERSDALFRDPFSRELAGDVGGAIAREMGGVDLIAPSVAIRTAVLDRLILETVTRYDVDLLLNIGSGLDTRPWRLDLPTQLQWLDIDWPELVTHKSEVLARQPPNCKYEAFGVDLLHSGQRSAILAAYSQARRILVVTEGLLVYLQPAQVERLATDLHRQRACQWWLTDLVGSPVVRVSHSAWAAGLQARKFDFGPPDSVGFFARLGWHEHSFHSSEEEARRLNRLAQRPWITKLRLKLASHSFREDIRRLAGVATLARQARNPPTSPDRH